MPIDKWGWVVHASSDGYLSHPRVLYERQLLLLYGMSMWVLLLSIGL